MKKCYRCGLEKEQVEFYKHPANADGHSNRCKECTKKDVKENYEAKREHYLEYNRSRPNAEERKDKNITKRREKYSADPDFRRKKLDYSKQDRINNPDKYKARDALTIARRNFTLITPENCEHCGKTGIRIEGHHWSYLPEHWLDVIWLCTSCHGKEHKRLNALGRDPDKQTQEDAE